jgi:hypothetical protein
MVTSTRQETNKRMLKLMEYYISQHSEWTESAYLERIGFSRFNISNVRSSRQSFTLDHVREACLFTGADANWLMGLPGSTMMRKEGNSSPIERIEQAVVEIKSLLAVTSKEKKK